MGLMSFGLVVDSTGQVLAWAEPSDPARCGLVFQRVGSGASTKAEVRAEPELTLNNGGIRHTYRLDSDGEVVGSIEAGRWGRTWLVEIPQDLPLLLLVLLVRVAWFLRGKGL